MDNRFKLNPSSGAEGQDWSTTPQPAQNNFKGFSPNTLEEPHTKYIRSDVHTTQTRKIYLFNLFNLIYLFLPHLIL